MDEGKIWSFVRSVMEQGASVMQDYAAGKFSGYEDYSAHLDGMSAMRAEEFSSAWLAEIESARTNAIALERRRDAWRDSAILSQRSASEFAQQVDQQATELVGVRAENERLRKALAEVVMCSELSSSTKDGCANIARAALAQGKV